MMGKTLNVPIKLKQFWNAYVGGTVWLEGRGATVLGGLWVKRLKPSQPSSPAWCEMWQVYRTFGQMYLFNEEAKTGWKQITWDFKCLELWTLLHKLWGPLKLFEQGVMSSVFHDISGAEWRIERTVTNTWSHLNSEDHPLSPFPSRGCQWGR